MRTPYSFSVLRYVHDPVTQEFLNIGIALYSSESKFLRAKCTPHYARISRTFRKIDRDRFRQLTGYIESEVRRLGEKLVTGLPFEPSQTIERLLAKVLPPDDSALQFSPVGVGLSHDLERTLNDLFNRYVDLYAASNSPRRDDDEIWRKFKEPLEKRHVTNLLAPKKIMAPDYEYEFEHAWKNQQWHMYEPISFDLVKGGDILDKANRWLGRATSLADSPDKFELHLLLGEPQDEGLQKDFVRAKNILHKIPVKNELIAEAEAEDFAAAFEAEVQKHCENEGTSK